MVVRGASSQLLDKLRSLPTVKDVAVEKVYPLVTPVAESAQASEISSNNAKVTAAGNRNPQPVATTISWGVRQIDAPATWTAGNTGVVVGTIDTGVRCSHQALAKNFRSFYG